MRPDLTAEQIAELRRLLDSVTPEALGLERTADRAEVDDALDLVARWVGLRLTLIEMRSTADGWSSSEHWANIRRAVLDLRDAERALLEAGLLRPSLTPTRNRT